MAHDPMKRVEKKMRIALCNEVLGGMPLERQCEYAAALGYDGLEIAPFTLSASPEKLSSAEAAKIRSVVEASGFSVTGLHWLLVKPDGLSLTDPDAAVRTRTIEVMIRLTALCAELGGAVLVHGSPKQRAIPAGESHATALSRLRDGLVLAASAAAKAGVIYCIEPLSPRETALVNTVTEAAELVRAIDHPNLRTMIDCSAAGLAEAEPVPDLIDRWLPTGLIAHLQVNDPNRRGPGQGEMKFGSILAALKRHDYTGTIAVEPFDYSPDGPGVAAFSAGYLRGLREVLG
jgi:D-psicose/D-tagatose/L-ribulose 3-epimerase